MFLAPHSRAQGNPSMPQKPTAANGGIMAPVASMRVMHAHIAATPDWPEAPQFSAVVPLPIQSQTSTHTTGENTAKTSFRLQPSLELYFATYRLTSQE